MSSPMEPCCGSGAGAPHLESALEDAEKQLEKWQQVVESLRHLLAGREQDEMRVELLQTRISLTTERALNRASKSATTLATLRQENARLRAEIAAWESAAAQTRLVYGGCFMPATSPDTAAKDARAAAGEEIGDA